MHSQSQETQRYEHRYIRILQSEEYKQPLEGIGEENPGWAICRGLIKPVNIGNDGIRRRYICWRLNQWIKMVDYTYTSISNIGKQIPRSDERNKYIQKTE